MIKSFQKSANSLHELQLPHPGIIDAEYFNDHFQLRCYEPSFDLRPFLVHIWTQRRRPLHNPEYRPTEVLSGPNMYLFFTPEAAFIHGVTPQQFTYDALASNVIAGVKFRPGGFYPFLRQSLSRLKEAPSLESLFPDANTVFRKKLLDQPDETIVAMLEALLRKAHPKNNKSLALVTAILEALDNDSSLQTVGTVAQSLGISERSLQLLFQTHVGTGLKWILTRRRLLESISFAKAHPRLSWAEVAAEQGYSSQSHFCREFKEVIGQAPSYYLKR